MIARPGHKTAFIVGVLVYSPSLTFVAAVQAVATSKEDVAVSVLELALVIAITLAFAWVPAHARPYWRTERPAPEDRGGARGRTSSPLNLAIASYIEFELVCGSLSRSSPQMASTLRATRMTPQTGV